MRCRASCGVTKTNEVFSNSMRGVSWLTGRFVSAAALLERNDHSSPQIFEQIRLNVDEQRKHGLAPCALVAINRELRQYLKLRTWSR